MKDRFLPLIISLVGAILLFFTVEDFFHQVIVEPLLYVSWFVALVLGSIPQWVFWAAFIVVAMVAARKSLARAKIAANQPSVPTMSRQGPVADWFALLERSQSQTFARWRLAQALRRLTQETLFADASPYLSRRGEGWQRTKPTLPAEIHAYFEAPLSWAQRPFRLWFFGRIYKRPAALDLDPETVVKYLEQKLDPLSGE